MSEEVLAARSAGHLISFRNHHIADCGTPPDFDAMKGVYRGYFCDMHGEQFVYIHDYTKKTDLLYVGDASWESPVRVESAGYLAGENGTDTGWLTRDVRAWLAACWYAARRDLP